VITPSARTWPIARGDDQGGQRAEKKGMLENVKFTSLPPGAKLINGRCVYKLKFRDGLYERRRARLVAMPWAITKKQGMIISRAFCPHAHALPYVSCLHSHPFMVAIRWIWMPCALSSQVTLLQESVSIWKARLVTILVRVIACTCSSASTAWNKQLVNTTCSVVKFTRKLAWSNFRRMNAFLFVTSLTLFGNKSHKRRPAYQWQVSQHGCGTKQNARLRVVLSSGGCYDPSDVCGQHRRRSSRIGGLICNEGELDWFLSVRYTYDKGTGAIGCNQKAYIDQPWLVAYSRCAWQDCRTCLLCSDWLASLHCYQHSASAQLLQEQFDSIHVKGDAGTSCLRQNGAQILLRRERQTAHMVW